AVATENPPMASAPPASQPLDLANPSQETGVGVSGKPGTAVSQRPRGKAREHVSHAGLRALVVLGGLGVAALLVWQALTAGGNPNPLAAVPVRGRRASTSAYWCFVRAWNVCWFSPPCWPACPPT